MSESENMIKCEVILVVFEVGTLSKELQFGHYKRELVTSVGVEDEAIKGVNSFDCYVLANCFILVSCMFSVNLLTF